MMDNTSENNCRKSPENRNIRPSFSPFFLRKCLTNSGRYRIYKPVSDWPEMLPLDSTRLNMEEYFLLDINEMKRNDLWLNVKAITCALCAKDTFEFIPK